MPWLLWMCVVACGAPGPVASGSSEPPATAQPSEPAKPILAPASRSVDLPAVTGHGYALLAESDDIAVIATKTGIVVDGMAIASIENGQVDPSAKEGGALGVKIERLTMFVEKLVEARRQRGLGDPRVLLLLDKSTPYRLLVEVIFSIKQTGVKRFELVARKGEALVAVPIGLPDKRVHGQPQTLGIFVSITNDKVVVWSLSGQEGTLKQPKRELDRASPAVAVDTGSVLLEIVQRRWGKAARPPEERGIVIQAHAAMPMQLIAELLGAVRATPDGRELFPELALSSGFE